MKLKHLSAIPMLFVFSLIISSCVVNHEVEKRLIGKWNPVNVENLTPQMTLSQPMKTIKVDTSSDPDTKKEIELTLPANPDEKTAKFQRAVATEMRSPIMIAITNNQRIVEKYFPGKTATGTWKLKKNGKRVAVKETKTGRKFTLDIISLSDSIAVVHEKLPLGEIKIKYAKQK